MKKRTISPIAAIIAIFVVVFMGCQAQEDTSAGGSGGSDTKTLSGTVTIGPSSDVSTGTGLTAEYSGTEAVSYQWNRDGAAISGATGTTYTPQTAGTYTVTVSAPGYNRITSAAVTVTGSSLPALTGTVSISGTAEAGQILTANTDSLGGSGTISYQWKRGGTDVGASGSSYTVQSADIGSTITVTVTRSGNSGSVTSDPTSAVTAEAPPTSGLSYTKISDGTAWSVSRGTANAAEVVIPALREGLPVTAIADFSFYTNMTSIRISDRVTSISQTAFANCTGLTSVTIPNTVTSIGSNAFMGCTALTSITIPFLGAALNDNYPFGYIFGTSSYNDQNSYIPASLKTVIITGGDSIPAYAFSGCARLTSVTIPDSVTSIGNNAFSGCTDLRSVTFQGTIASKDFSGSSSFPGDLRDKYLDGGKGTYTRESGSEMWYNTPVATNFTISGTGVFFYDGIAKTVTAMANSGALGGAVTVKYNGSTITPSAIGTYTVTFDVAAAGSFRAATGLIAGTLIIIGPVEMVSVPGGSFRMGKELGITGSGDITPVHTVTLSGFYIGKYEVTQNQYQAVMGTNPSYFNSSPASGEVQGNRPVERISWYDAIVFCNKLSIAEGISPAYRISGSTNPSDWGTVPTSSNSRWNSAVIVADSDGYRLPTEAQWEYAAKGGNGTPENYTYSGSNTIEDVVWYSDNSDGKTHEAGKKQPNGLGLYDMSGNVWEWCWDRYGDYSGEVQTDPMGAAVGDLRVVRGGGWCFNASYACSVYRFNHYPVDWDSSLGFRLVRP